MAGSSLVAPAAPAVGDLPTATYADQVAAAIAALAATPTWTAPTLQTGFGVLGGAFQVPGYYIDPLGWVHLRGALVNTSGATKATGTTFFTLPAGYRPAAERGWTCETASGVYIRVDVLATGAVVLGSATAMPIGGYAFLDSIRFYSEA